jgi:hypothetical protein
MRLNASNDPYLFMASPQQTTIHCATLSVFFSFSPQPIKSIGDLVSTKNKKNGGQSGP